MIAFFYIYLLLHTIATIAKASCELNMKDFFICMLHVRYEADKKDFLLQSDVEFL